MEFSIRTRLQRLNRCQSKGRIMLTIVHGFIVNTCQLCQANMRLTFHKYIWCYSHQTLPISTQILCKHLLLFGGVTLIDIGLGVSLPYILSLKIIVYATFLPKLTADCYRMRYITINSYTYISEFSRISVNKIEGCYVCCPNFIP